MRIAKVDMLGMGEPFNGRRRSCAAVTFSPETSRGSRHGKCREFLVEIPCPSVPWFFGFPWLIFNKEFPWLFWRFLFLFQGICGFGKERKSFVNLRVFLGKNQKIKERKDRVLPFLFPQEMKLESAQNFSRLISRRFSPDALRLQIAEFHGIIFSL